MSFTYSGAYVGPYSVSLGRGKKGEIQRFRFPVPCRSDDELGNAQIILGGQISVSWTSDESSFKELGVGGSLYLDQRDRPLPAVNEEMTLRALSDCSYLCIAAVGVEQRVFLSRHYLEPGEHTVVDRYALLAVAGDDVEIQINGTPPKKGIRIVYARST